MKVKLIKWIVINQHPFTIVEQPNFISFVHTLYPATKMPSADTVKRYIVNSYETARINMQNILENLSSKISFTTDIWTSPNTKSFLSLTAHFINENWELQNVLVDFIQIHGSHTGENIKNTFVSGLNNLSIQNKVYLYFYIYIFLFN